MAGMAGFDCVLKIGGTEVGIAQDVDVSMTRDEIEDTTRANVGWKSFIAGLAEGTITFTLLNDRPNDTAGIIAAVQAAFMAGTVIEDVEFLDRDGYGWKSDVAVTEFSRGEPLNDAVTFSTTFRVRGIPEEITPSS